jgi:CO/xanthine dehydrogenase Mo-binding subunit
MSLVNRYIGAPVKRVEDFRFLRGRGEFVADLTHAETLHAAILRGSVAHARIRAIDPKPALAIAGVHAVITAAEIGTVPTEEACRKLLDLNTEIARGPCKSIQAPTELAPNPEKQTPTQR